MERDFTMEKYEELCGYLPSDSEKFSDFFGDMGLKNYDDYPDGLGTDLATIQSYYINVLDNNDMTKGELNNIFCHAREADDSYANILKAITELAESYKMYLETLKSSLISGPTFFTSNRINTKFKLAIEDYYKSTYLYMRSIVEDAKWNWNNISEEDKKKLDEYYEELAVYYRENNKIESMDEDEKAFLIWYFEAKHPEYAQNMNTCLTPISEAKRDDIVTNIKLYAYMAPEPFRMVYLEMAGDIKIVDIECEGRSNYSSEKGGISIDLNRANNKEFYTTFFHENGHMIDDLLADKGYLTGSYENQEGMTLSETLENEVRENIRQCAEGYLTERGYDAETKEAIIAEVENAIMNCFNKDDYNPTFGNEYVKDCYEYVYNELDKEVSDISSDVYGGFTGNLINDEETFHQVIKKPGEKETYGYWVKTKATKNGIEPIYASDGSLQYRTQEKEFFAEYFAAHMTHNVKDLESLDGPLLDDSKEYADEYMNEMYENIDK